MVNGGSQVYRLTSYFLPPTSYLLQTATHYSMAFRISQIPCSASSKDW